MRDRPLRVLHVINSFSVRGNGVVNVALDIACTQADQGIAVAMCGTAGGHPDFRLLDAHRVEHFLLPPRKNALHLLRSGLALLRIIRSYRPDVVHCHVITGMFLSRLVKPFAGGYRLVSHVHNVHEKSSDLMKWAERVIVISEGVREDMVRRGMPLSKIRLVYNGTIGSPRLPEPESVAPAALLQPAIVTVAGMNRRKGIPELIAAFEQTAVSHPAAHLYIVGTGPDQSAFEELARRSAFASHIHFEGFQANPLSYMKAAQIFVLASLRESFGLVLTEAREVGCAIIASNVDGIPEALDHGRAGLLVPAGDIKALAGAMVLLLNDDKARWSFGCETRKNLARFTVRRMTDEIMKVYEEFSF